MDVERIIEGMRKIEEGKLLLDSGPFDYTMKCLFAAHEALLTRYAPFKVGDRVRLSKTPVINECTAPGWMRAEHFLIKGAAGTVKDSHVSSNGDLFFGVVFDHESWIGPDGVEHCVSGDNKAMFTFAESWLEPL